MNLCVSGRSPSCRATSRARRSARPPAGSRRWPRRCHRRRSRTRPLLRRPWCCTKTQFPKQLFDSCLLASLILLPFFCLLSAVHNNKFSVIHFFTVLFFCCFEFSFSSEIEIVSGPGGYAIIICVIVFFFFCSYIFPLILIV